MFTGHNSKFWDDRYGESVYAYGTVPNQFLTEQQHRFTPGMRTLVVGDGEGRNGVWLATQGLDVLSIDRRNRATFNHPIFSLWYDARILTTR